MNIVGKTSLVFSKREQPWLEQNTLYLTKSGSHAYGTNIETSDLDVKGIAHSPKSYYMGFVNRFEQAEFKEPADAVIYEIQKFFKLAADCNPNIIEMLWTDPSDHLYVDPLMERIIDRRSGFLSKKAKHSFSGYAISQLKRLQSRRNAEPLTNREWKHAMHLVRLMRMAREVLTEGEVIVKRPDAEELLAIRRGAWSYDELVEWAERQDKELQEIYKTSTVLPKKPNRNALDQLCQEVLEEALRR